MRRCSVEPGEIRLISAEQTGECINQNRKGRLATLTAGLAKRQTPLNPVVTFDAVGASRALSPPHTKSQGPFCPVVGGCDAMFHTETPIAMPSPFANVWPSDRHHLCARGSDQSSVQNLGIAKAPTAPPVGGALAMWHKRCNSFSAHLPQAESSGLDVSAKPLAVRIRWAKQVCRRLTEV